MPSVFESFPFDFGLSGGLVWSSGLVSTASMLLLTCVISFLATGVYFPYTCFSRFSYMLHSSLCCQIFEALGKRPLRPRISMMFYRYFRGKFFFLEAREPQSVSLWGSSKDGEQFAPTLLIFWSTVLRRLTLGVHLYLFSRLNSICRVASSSLSRAIFGCGFPPHHMT